MKYKIYHQVMGRQVVFKDSFDHESNATTAFRDEVLKLEEDGYNVKRVSRYMVRATDSNGVVIEVFISHDDEE